MSNSPTIPPQESAASRASPHGARKVSRGQYAYPADTAAVAPAGAAAGAEQHPEPVYQNLEVYRQLLQRHVSGEGDATSFRCLVT